MRLDLGDEEDAGLNLTPLIDMVFLLLVFFLAATTFHKDEVDMNLDLPQAVHGQARKPQQLLTVNVQKDGTLSIDGRQVTLEGLHQRLRAAAQRSKEQPVLIRGDTTVQLGRVAQVLDACRGASLTKVSIAAVPIGGIPR
jgi:biopolymer transport protein ExbD